MTKTLTYSIHVSEEVFEKMIVLREYFGIKDVSKVIDIIVSTAAQKLDMVKYEKVKQDLIVEGVIEGKWETE